MNKETRGAKIGDRALDKGNPGNLGRPGAKKGGGGKMEMGSIRGAVKMLDALKKGEPHCG